jgi:RNA polymerase sigma-70 factor (ECF subfamily)
LSVLGATDDVLLAGLAAGDSTAAEAFVQRFSPRCIGLAHQLVGDRNLAEDIAQEAFLRAYRHATSYDPRKGAVSTWLYSIVRHLSIDALRLRRADPYDPSQPPGGFVVDREPGPERVAEHNDDALRLRMALASVPVAQRRALLLAYGGRSASEVAVVEQIPLGTAKTRIRQGLLRLRASYLQHPGVEGCGPVERTEEVEG